MSKALVQYAVTPAVVERFLRKTLPFCDLDAGILERISRRWVIDYYPKGTTILMQDVTDVNYLHLIQKGGVKTYVTSADTVSTLTDYGGEGSTFGAMAMIRGHKSDFNVETVEDTFCFLLAKEDFLELMEDNPRFAKYYLDTFSDDLVCAAYSELRCEKIRARTQDSLFLFNSRVTELVRNAPEIVPASTSIRHAAQRMSVLGIGSVLVHDEAGDIAGIVTDKDLRSKVVASGLDPDSPVGVIMTTPVHTIHADLPCFDALLKIVSERIDHLAVESRRQIVGVVSARDIMVSQGVSPLYIFREAASQRKFEGLYDLAKKLPILVRRLIEEGAKAGNITKMISLLSDKIQNRLLTLLTEQMGPPPAAFAWLALGSEGRNEQIFPADQKNAIVYKDPADKWEEHAVDVYFETFAQLAVEHLGACGYPRSDDGITASKPRWRKPYSMWCDCFVEWVSSPQPNDVSAAIDFFDFRPNHGDLPLGHDLRHRLTSQAERHYVFLMHLAGECLRNWPPLSFFRHFVVEKDGEHKNQLDLRARGVLPFVDFARLMALRYGIEETNTLERLELLAQRGRISREFYEDMREAYEFQSQLILVHQLHMIETGLTPETFIEPAVLSDLEKRTLKDAFAVINRMLAFIKHEFPGAT
jgi:CBS domain-containing protein